MELKIAFLIIVVSVSNVLAIPTYSQVAKVSLVMENRSLEQVMDEIERQSEFYFIFNQKQIDVNRVVDIQAENKLITDILPELFKGTNVNYVVLDRKILLTTDPLENNLKAIASGTEQQQNRVTGTVTGKDGTPLPGVNVVVTGTTLGAITDFAGKFSIEVPQGSKSLTFSFIGMKSQEISIGTLTQIDVTMAESAIGLDEVVVVGYGTQRRATITGSVASIRGEDFIAPTMNASNALSGRIPGLVTYQRSGEPGQDGTTIRIRGRNTLGDSAPLVVVDGVPGRSLERIDPNTIESISVLKDASSAIYGARAANGVILITTKRGKIGKPEINVIFNQGFNQPTRIPKMANATEYATMLNEQDIYRNLTPRYTDEEIQKFKDGTDPWLYPNTDYFKESFKSWANQNNLNVTMSGGSEFMKYFVSLGSKYQDGYYKNSAVYYHQYDFRSNMDAKISENIKIMFDIAGRMEGRNNTINSATSIYRLVMRGKPTIHAFYPDGSPCADFQGGGNPAVVATNALGYNRNKTYVVNSNMKLDVNIPWIKGLSLSSNVGLDKQFQFEKNFSTPWYLYSWDKKTFDENGEPVLLRGQAGAGDPSLNESMYDRLSLLVNANVNYQKSFDRHNIMFLAGIETIKGEGDNFSAFRRYFITTSIDELFAGGDNEKTNSGSSYENARLNYFGRLNYNYDEKILLEFVWRYDGSYIFPKDGRFGFFPGISVGWRLSEENFWKESLPFFESFKIRASWGQTGNDRIDEWQYLSTYAMASLARDSYVFGVNQQSKILSEQRIPNKNVTWEVASQANLGFEGSLFKDKLFFELDFFDQRRFNILWVRNASVPSSTGLALPRENIGKVKNQGVDFLLGYRYKLSNFGYTISLNGGYAKNEVVFWDEAPGVPEWQKSTGKPIPTNSSSVQNDLYYQKIGIFKDQAAIDAYPHWQRAIPGDVIFKDVNEDGKIDGNDMVRNDKNDIPRFTGGLSLDLTYKQFDLSMLFQGSAGAVFYTVTEFGEIGNYLKQYFDDRWTIENPVAVGPRTNSSTAEYWLENRNTNFLYNSNYFRLKNLQFGYTLPVSINRNLGIAGVRFYFSGYNLFTISQMKDFDPEVVTYNAYTVQRIVSLGVNLTF